MGVPSYSVTGGCSLLLSPYGSNRDNPEDVHWTDGVPSPAGLEKTLPVGDGTDPSGLESVSPVTTAYIKNTLNDPSVVPVR